MASEVDTRLLEQPNAILQQLTLGRLKEEVTAS
jgi:hypothetical protein